MVSEALPDEPAASTTTLVSPSVDGAANGIFAVPDASVTAVPIGTTPTGVSQRPSPAVVAVSRRAASIRTAVCE